MLHTRSKGPPVFALFRVGVRPFFEPAMRDAFMRLSR